MSVQTDLAAQEENPDAAGLPSARAAGETHADNDDDTAAATPDGGNDEPRVEADLSTRRRRINWRRAFVCGVLPGLALLLTLTAGFWKWRDCSARDSGVARVESVQAAKDSTVAMLSYQPDSVEKDLTAAESRMAGTFRDSYTKLIRDVVIPGAKQKRISAVANVPAAASVSATPSHAVVLVFVNQTSIVGNEAPTETASSVRITLDKVGGHWLIASFDPI